MMNDQSVKRVVRLLQTSECGTSAPEAERIQFTNQGAGRNVITINLAVRKQTLQGIGTSFTEASAFVLASLEPESRQAVMRNIFSDAGANFSIARTHIASCDFCVEGHYTYAEVEADTALKHFSIGVDKDGFDSGVYPEVKDPKYDLLPMIKEALQIKSCQDDSEFKLVSSAWTAPPWMKDNNSYHDPGTEQNGYSGYGGVLKPEYESVYANYLVKYLEAYRAEGVDIWGLTPVNEPGGNNGNWESMHFTPQTQNTFIKKHLGPALKQHGYGHINLMMFDHNSGGLEDWADEILGDEETSQYVYGSAVHWYEGTKKVFEDVFDRVHDKYPEFPIIHTEGCIDDLGNEAKPGIRDPERYQESGWFDDDAFWWNENATDWAYSAEWESAIAEDHPIYAPVHRYAQHIITGMNHWLSAWIDWNIVLDARGGPNHVGNYCGAPIMIDTHSGYVYYTPVFSILKQFSQTIRPQDVVVETTTKAAPEVSDVFWSSASISAGNLLSIQVFNGNPQSLDYSVKVGEQVAHVMIPANCLQTLVVQM